MFFTLLQSVAPFFLILMGGYLTVATRCFALVHPIAALRSLWQTGGAAGGVSPFRALSLALAGTLGVGNIVGVSSAIALGGAGAIFWMWVSAFLAMVVKYAEILLAVNTRKQDRAGNFYGGAMYYIRAALPRFGKMAAAFFALLCVGNALSMGCAMQANAVVGAVCGVSGLPAALVGLFLSATILLLSGRGVKDISALTGVLVPLMTGGFFVLSLAVLVIRRDAIPAAFFRILSEAFQPLSAAGGILGFFFSKGLRVGVMRGLLSNEAGCGTAPMAHAAANVSSGAAQGIFGMAEVFVDTLLLCTMTALVILVCPTDLSGMCENPVMMTVSAYSSVLGDWCAWVLAVAVLLFGFATLLCWSQYGLASLRYLTRNRGAARIFLFVYALCTFAGSLAAPNALWAISDTCLSLMTILNLLAIFRLRRDVVGETLERFGR